MKPKSSKELRSERVRAGVGGCHPMLIWLRAAASRRAARLKVAWLAGDRGASAVELAVITAVILGVALALLLVIKNFVTTESQKIHG